MKLLLNANQACPRRSQKYVGLLVCLLIVSFGIEDSNAFIGRQFNKPFVKVTVPVPKRYSKITNHHSGTPGSNDIGTYQYLRLQLAKDIINTDDILIRFQKSVTAAFDPTFDARYFQGNGQVNLCSFSSDRVPLAINLQPYPKTTASIGLNVFAKSDGLYQLNMTQIVSIPRLFDIWLVDAYKKDSIDMRKHARYGFDIVKSDTNTFGSQRFTLVIRQNPIYAYCLLNFTAAKVADSGVKLAWNTKNEEDYTGFIIERSINNGLTFESLDTLASNGLGNYNFLDKSPAPVGNIYRLKQQDFNNTISYSDTVMIAFPDLKQPANILGLFPNPVVGQLNLIITPKSPDGANFGISIFNMAGFLVKQTSSRQNNWQGDVAGLKPGTYIIKVSNLKDHNMIGDIKFIKL